ncbi:MAG: hypothetical protein QOJ39_2216, partial [Candidatus Eremiobacteraeota bacterium]|nr:hypothetical protein [Candidatus Eremiobacteraeota bacterium]
LSRVLEQKTADCDHVFVMPDGALWTRHVFYGRWLRLLKEAGVPAYHFHSARHTMATDLLRAGHYLTAVSKRLGHSKPSITLDIYSDAIPQDQQRLADAFDQRINGLRQPSVDRAGLQGSGPENGPGSLAEAA